MKYAFWLLKDIGYIIAPTLSVIINQPLYTGIFPKQLKIAKVIPLFKKGEETSIGNYRPISLLSSISKVFERVVFNQLYQYLNVNDLLFDSQYGFRKQHSTELAALELIDRIHKSMDNGQIPVSIFLDLSKAFDTLDHTILLSKLKYYGIKNKAFQWFNSSLKQASVCGIWGCSLRDIRIRNGCATRFHIRTSAFHNIC